MRMHSITAPWTLLFYAKSGYGTRSVLDRGALVQLAVFWVWSPEASLVVAANSAVDLVRAIYGAVPVGSYQALVKVLKRYSSQLLPLLWSRLHHLMEECDQEKWRVGLWLALAMDGSRVSVPRTERNEQQFCKPVQGK